MPSRIRVDGERRTLSPRISPSRPSSGRSYFTRQGVGLSPPSGQTGHSVHQHLPSVADELHVLASAENAPLFVGSVLAWQGLAWLFLCFHFFQPALFVVSL